MSKLAGLTVILGLVLGGTAPPQVEYIDPAGSYTQVVTTTDRGVKTVFVSGQVGEGADFAAHVESAFAALVHRLEQAGATTSDVVKIRIFVKDLSPELYGTVAEVRRKTFPEGSWPASTVAGVQSLARDRFRVEVEAIAVVAEKGVDLGIERLAPSNGFSGSVAVTAHGVTTIYVSGQVGEGDGLGAQAVSVWQRVGQRLEAAGATYGDLVKTTVYLVDFNPDADLSVYGASYPEAIARTENKPASTLLGVPALASERFEIEIDAIAVVGTEAPLEREFFDPERSYTQVVTAQGAGAKTIYLAGQIGRQGDSLADQADQVFANLAQRLAAAGASPSDLLKITIYIPGFSEADLAVLGPAREKHGFLNDTAPASTLLGIQSLYSTEAAIEVEGIATVGR
jgi:enamine deaminase RidA (YjgF/YER057c/UK114 family)